MDSYTHERLKTYGVDELRIQSRNLEDIDLSRSDLSGCDLRGFTVTKTNFEYTMFYGADLRGVQFGSTNCVFAWFIGADLRGANLSFGYFHHADFRGADLRGARLADALCSECDFTGVDLRGAYLGIGHYDSDFRGADLRGAEIPEEGSLEKLGCDSRESLSVPEKKGVSRNKRRQKRIPVTPHLTVFERRTRALIGSLVDITTQGVKILSKNPLQVNTVYYIGIELPDGIGFGDTLEIDIKSVWCKPNPYEEGYNTGFVIQKVSQEGIRSIDMLIREYSMKEVGKVR
jgi:uncharacterized protein YjbI with pentapeptide repeats